MENQHSTKLLMKNKLNMRQKSIFLYILKSYKNNIIMCIMFLTIMIAMFYYSQFHKHELPNLTKKLTAEPKPYYFNYALDDMVVLQQTILSLQEKAKILDINIKILEGMFDGLRIGTKQNGGYVNARQVKKLFNEALKVYDADKMGMQDYALLFTGAAVLDTPETIAAPVDQYKLYGFTFFTVYSQPTELLHPDVNPGRCFAFMGTWGRIQILLSRKIFINAITMEHTYKAIVGLEIRSAPKVFAVFGFENRWNTSLIELGTYNYSINGPARQTFFITKEKQTQAFDFVELRILSNHGRPDYTCVYRFRVHGHPY